MNAEHGAIIFDIDRIVEQEILTGREILGQEMDRLHADVWAVFSSAKGEKLEALLSRRQRGQIQGDQALRRSPKVS